MAVWFSKSDGFYISAIYAFATADSFEFNKLAASYPAEAQAYELWNRTPDPVEFFNEYGAWNSPRHRK